MASTNFTTHYEIPLPLGTDLTTPMDYNTSMEAVDTALFGAVSNATQAATLASQANDTANAAASAAGDVAADLTVEKAKIVALQTRMTNAENGIDDVRADVQDAICAYNEPTATSTHHYNVGDYFFYNDTLYIATAEININDTITPNTNCDTTTITAELLAVNNDISTKASKTELGLEILTDVITISNSTEIGGTSGIHLRETCAKVGYDAIGIVAITTTGFELCVVQDFQCYSDNDVDTVDLYVLNTSTTPRTPTRATVRVLYKKSTS